MSFNSCSTTVTSWSVEKNRRSRCFRSGPLVCYRLIVLHLSCVKNDNVLILATRAMIFLQEKKKELRAQRATQNLSIDDMHTIRDGTMHGTNAITSKFKSLDVNGGLAFYHIIGQKHYLTKIKSNDPACVTCGSGWKIV